MFHSSRTSTTSVPRKTDVVDCAHIAGSQVRAVGTLPGKVKDPGAKKPVKTPPPVKKEAKETRKETGKEKYIKRDTEISVLSYSKNIFFLFIGGESPFELRASNPFPKVEKIPDGTDTSVLWRRADAVASAFLSEFAKRGCAEIHVSGNIGLETFFPSSGKLPAAETFSIFVLTSFVFKCAPLKIRTFLQSPEWFSAWEKERKQTDKQVKPVREKLSKPEGWDNTSFFYDKGKDVRSKKNIGQKSANGKNEKSEKQKGGNGTIDRSVGKKRSSAVSLLKETLVELFS